MHTGKDLIRDINSAKVRHGQLALWWLGQASFIVKTPTAIIYLDPFLTDLPGRLIPPLLSAGDVTNGTIIAGTHDHVDHIDRDAWPVLAKSSPQALFIVPDLLRKRLAEDLKIPERRLVGLDDGQAVELGKVRISGVASAHELLDRDEATGKYPHLGYVIEANGRAIYHSGDCCIYEGLTTRLRQWKFDAMILPINGRDAVRYAARCLGNMTYQEAVDLGGVLGAKMIIPSHYDMFATNLGPLQAFLDFARVKYPAMQAHVCRYGKRLDIS
jgi:L-ascorbate metabolism protein UlaG (beta-lactamase superfamily)